MNQFRLISLILAAGWLGECGECRRVIWKQRASLADAGNWVDEKAPCATDALLFPKQSFELMKLSNITMREIILPKTGSFVLEAETALKFSEHDAKCSQSSTRTFKSVINAAWLSTDNWSVARDENAADDYTKATPHEQRLPCDNDEIVFPANASYVVDLQLAPVLSFKSIAIDGRVLSVNEFRSFLSSAFGQSSFRNVDNTLIEEPQRCDDDSKCVCHRQSSALLTQLCANEVASCASVAHCSEPIRPLGHCCDECGAMFHMQLNAGDGFNLSNFRASFERAVNATSAVDPGRVVYHIGVAAQGARLVLQLIILDRFEYDELSTQLMDQLRTLFDGLYPRQSKFYFASGMSLSLDASGHVLAFIFGSFFAVSLFMTLIYAAYYDDRHIPRALAVLRNRRFRHDSDVTFARFDNSSQAHDTRSIAETVDLHFGTEQSIENLNSQAFNNPMFERETDEVELNAD